MPLEFEFAHVFFCTNRLCAKSDSFCAIISVDIVKHIRLGSNYRSPYVYSEKQIIRCVCSLGKLTYPKVEFSNLLVNCYLCVRIKSTWNTNDFNICVPFFQFSIRCMATDLIISFVILNS